MKPYVLMPTYQAGLIQARAYRALTQFVSGALRVYNLTMAEWALIGALHDAETIRPTELANHLAVKPPVVSKMIKSLVGRGWITLSTDTLDNRKRLVSLTPHGSNMVSKIEQNLRKEMHLFMRDVSPEELMGYMQTLVKLAAKMDQKT